MKEFPLDVNKVGYTTEILNSILSGHIHELCSNWQIPLPDELKEFCEKNDREAGYDWERRVMEASIDMPIELLEKWVNGMRGGFYRAEMRGLLKQRKQDMTIKTIVD